MSIASFLDFLFIHLDIEKFFESSSDLHLSPPAALDEAPGSASFS